MNLLDTLCKHLLPFRSTAALKASTGDLGDGMGADYDDAPQATPREAVFWRLSWTSQGVTL